MELLIIVIAPLLGLIPAVIARQKGHNPLIWWFGGTLLFIVALPLAMILEPNQTEAESRKLGQGMKKCPDCAELIKQEALVCRFCGREFQNAEERAQLGDDLRFAERALRKTNTGVDEAMLPIERKRTNLKPGSLWLKCGCNACSGQVEFDAVHVGEVMQCPHCGKETTLFVDPTITSNFPPRPTPPKQKNKAPL